MPLSTATCTHPDHAGERTLPVTSETFYVNPAGRVNYWCRACMRLDQAARRRAGGGNQGRKFGVEIEFVGSRATVLIELARQGLPVYDGRTYTHEVMRQWKVVTDGSLSTGYELVSPPLKGRRGLAELKKACKALEAAGCTVNTQCGLHVHHDVTDLNGRAFARLLQAWSANQGNIDMLVSRSRRDSRWARPLGSDEVAHAARLAPTADREAIRRHFQYADRYRALNVASFPRYGTVEVRQHQGTLNFDKIAAWVALGQAFIVMAKSDATLEPAADVFALIRRLQAHGKLSADNANYLAGRAAHFSGRAVPVAA